MNKTFIAVLTGCLLPIAGCASSPSNETVPDEGDTAGSLCPSCRSQVGGQTSDFGGITQLCDWEELELTAQSKASYDTDSVTAQLEAGMELPLFWSAIGVDDDFAAPAPNEAASESVIEATFTIGDFQRWTDPSCGEKVETAVTMMVSTRDGHLQAELHGKLSRTPNEPFWRMFLTADLDAVTGTVELPIDDTRIHDGELISQVFAADDGFSGTIEARIAYYEDEEEYEVSQSALGDTPIGEHQNLLYAWFPEGAIEE